MTDNGKKEVERSVKITSFGTEEGDTRLHGGWVDTISNLSSNTLRLPLYANELAASHIYAVYDYALFQRL